MINRSQSKLIAQERRNQQRTRPTTGSGSAPATQAANLVAPQANPAANDAQLPTEPLRAES